MPPKKVQSDRTALDELMAKGLKHKKQERWVVLGGLCGTCSHCCPNLTSLVYRASSRRVCDILPHLLEKTGLRWWR